ncbi:MAG: hypothetical protein ACTHNS_11685 [Marmoricola sp.]
MHLSTAVKVAGAIFVLASGLGFLFENFWVFLAGQLLLLAWVGAVLVGPAGDNG